MARQTGTEQRTTCAGETVAAFVPFPLPPSDPPLDLDVDARAILARAEEALRRLDLAGGFLRSVDGLVDAFVRREAVLTSQIEGTQATLVDLLEFESDGEPAGTIDPDVEEVCNDLDALSHARAELQRPDGLPLSMRLLNDTHAVLMRGARGADKQPGAVRRSQNWIGGSRPGNARFVPPPPDALPDLLSAFERSIHQPDDLPALVRVGLLHVQFETIHPYLDGNGRIGRLLIALLLEQFGLLAQPLCYLSLHFKRHRREYYDRLHAVRTDGDWEGWTRFFLDGVATVASEATTLATEVFARIAADRQRVHAAGTSTLAAARLFELLPRHPIVTIARAMELLDTTRPTATKAVGALVEAGVLVERSGRKRDQRFGYARYLELLGHGTEVE
jgi:Fic family protein